MRRARKIALVLAVAAVALAAVAYFGQFAYLRTGSAKHLAAAKIGERLGGNVRVTELSGGVGSTDVHIEIEGTPGGQPLVAGTVSVDVSPLGLAAGREPSVIRLKNPTINLRLDADNNILGKLPEPPAGGGGGSLPNIVVNGATVHITQDGKPDFRVTGADLTLTSDGGKFTVAGGFNDPEYGPWKIAGDSDGKGGTVKLTTDGPVRLTPAKLKAVPFVPSETWEAIELDGMSTVDVRISRGADAKWSWRVECAPTGTKLTVFPVDLVVTDTSANVVVEGAKVTLKNVKGNSAGGTLASDGLLDFEKKPSELNLKIVAKNLDVKATPAEWGLAQRVDSGRLDGDADLKLVVAEGKVEPRGTGRARIVGKAFGGDAEIDVQLTSDGKRLKFASAPDKAALLPVAAVGLLLQPPPAKPAPKADPKPEYVEANLKLKNIDIAEFIKRGDIALPIKLAGRLSLDIKAEFPTNNLSGLKYYRAAGSLRIPSLEIEGLTLKDVSSDIRLKDGKLTLDHLSAAFPPGADGKPGGFLGTASFGIDPRTELAAKLVLDRIPLDQVIAAFPGFAGKAEGTVSGDFALNIPGDKLSDLTAIVAHGKLTSSGFTAFGQKAEKLALAVDVKAGVATLTEARIDIYKGSITGDAKLPLTGDKPGTFKIDFKGLDAEAVTRAIPNSPVKLAGDLTGALAGTAPPLAQFEAAKVTGDLALNSPRLVVQGVPTTKLAGKVGYKGKAITYDLKGDALGGTFDVEGTYPLGEQPAPEKKGQALPPAGGTIKLAGLRLDRLSRELRLKSLAPLQGVLSLNLTYTQGPDGLQGSGRLEIRDFGYGDDFAQTSDVAADIRVTSDGIEIPSLSGDVAGGRLRGRVRYDFDTPRLSTVNLRLDNADAATLLGPLGVTASGRVSVSLRSGIGREFRGGGTIAAARATVEGVEVTDLRIPYTFAKAPAGGAVVSVTDGRAVVAGGRVTGKLSATVSDAARLEGRVEFVDVNVATLSNSSALGLGKTTGRFDFGGPAVRTANDLGGTLTATFGQTSVRELPILGSLSPLTSPVQSLTRFDSGELVARLGGGRFRIERLALSGKSAKLFADGSVGLNSSLDLNVVYNSGTVGPSIPLLRVIARDIPAIGPIPVGLIVRATETLSNRVVRLTVGGTIARPTTAVNVANLLTENAVRFFVGQYVPLPTTPK